MSEAPVVQEEVRPRSRRQALLLAAATLWLPTLLPIVLGLLRDSSHALQSYLLFLPLVPTIVLPVCIRADDGWFVLAGVVPTLVALLAVYLAAREMPRRWLYLLQSVVIIGVALQAVLLAQLVRM